MSDTVSYTVRGPEYTATSDLEGHITVTNNRTGATLVSLDATVAYEVADTITRAARFTGQLGPVQPAEETVHPFLLGY